MCRIDCDQGPFLDFAGEDLKKNQGAGVDLVYELKVTAGTLMQQTARMISVRIITTM